MGGGSPADSDDTDGDDSWVEIPPPLPSNSGMKIPDLENIFGEKLVQSSGGSIHTADPTVFNNAFSAPAYSWNAELEAGRDYDVGLQSEEVVVEKDGREKVVKSEAEDPEGFKTGTEETLQDFRTLKRLSREHQESSLTLITDLTPNRKDTSSQAVRKRIFKLMQLENDNQDLSFVEKIIPSREEIFRFCNNMVAGAAKVSEGRGIIDFSSLNSKSLKVVGFFGSKEVMSEFFQQPEFMEDELVWKQMQDDTLAPGLYAWLPGNSLFLFYWHEGHSLPEALRKDMSCNFIRYIFDLCDTVCVCLDSKILKNYLFESARKLPKRSRTERLQISLVKASEDSVKVTDGFSMKTLPLCRGDEVLARSRSQAKGSLDVTVGRAFGQDYELSEGLSRVALLVSSDRRRELSSIPRTHEMNVDAFPASLRRWTVNKDRGLDLTNLSDSNFEVFIRCGKFKQAADFDRLKDSHEVRKAEEKKKDYTVDQFVEKEQERLSRCLQSFIGAFLKIRYPWEESLMLLSSSMHPTTPEDPHSTSKAGQSQQSAGVSHFPSDPSVLSNELDEMKLELRPSPEEDVREVFEDCLNQREADLSDLEKKSKQGMVSPTTEMTKPEDLQSTSKEGQQSAKATSHLLPHFSVLSTGLDGTKSELRPSPAERVQEDTKDDLNQLEVNFYSLLFGENSEQRMVFPTTELFIYDCLNQRYLKSGAKYTVSTKRPKGIFAPLFYGTKVTVRRIDDSSAEPIVTGAVQRYSEKNQEGPLLTDEEVSFVKSSRTGKLERVKLEPVRRTGELSAWLSQQAAREFPHLWKRAALLTAILEKLAESEDKNDFPDRLGRKSLASQDPLQELQPILLKPPILEFAQVKWEELRNLEDKSSLEVHQMAIGEEVQRLCLEMYEEFCEKFQSKISAQIQRFTTSLLKKKFRKQCAEEYERLEVTLKEEEKAFLASQKADLSKRKHPSSLTVEACYLTETFVGVPLKNLLSRWFDMFKHCPKIRIRFTEQQFEKQTIVWHASELVPMKEDLDQLITNDEHSFTPVCSPSKEVIDLDPRSETLLKVHFLKAGQLLLFIREVDTDSETLLIYHCRNLGAKPSTQDIVKRFQRGFDLIAFDERSRFIAFYRISTSTIKIFRFDERFRHMEQTGVEIDLKDTRLGDCCGWLSSPPSMRLF